MGELIRIVIVLGAVAGAITGIVAVLFGFGSLMNWLAEQTGTETGAGDVFINAGWLIILIVVILFIILAIKKIFENP